MSHDGYDSNFALNDPRENLAVHTESRVICDMVGRKGVGGEGQNNNVNAGECGAMTRAVMDPAIWTVVLTAADRDGVPTRCKIRRALKGLLRGYGLRALAVSERPEKTCKPSNPNSTN